MAAEYEVNIKLNTGKAETQLNNIESSVKKIGKTEKQAANESDRRVASLVKLRSIGNDVAALQQKGLDVSKAQFQIKKAGEAIEKKQFSTANARMGVAVKELNVQRGITKQLEQQEKARRRKRAQRLEGVALGAGFPLLFGGGPGSVLGGAAGGLTGSFGAQIAFSAIGQQIDQFIASVAAVGTALTSASGTVEMFREKNLFSSDAVKEHAFQLEEQGKMQELATLLTKDLASQIGVNAVKNFQELGGELKEFLGTINQLFLAVQGFVAGPLAKLLSAINTVLGGVSTEMQFKNLRGSLTGEAATQFEAIIAEARGTRKLTGRDLRTAQRHDLPTSVPGLLTTAAMQRALEDPRTAALRQTLDVTGQTTLDDTLGFKPPRDTEAEKAKREEERIQKRLGTLEEERKKILEVSRFKDKIAAAEVARDEQLVIRLQGEQKIAEIEAKRKQDLVDITDQRLIDSINIEAATEKLAAHRDVERELAAFERERGQRRIDDMKKFIEQQYELNEAVRQQRALADGIAQVMGQGMAQSFDLLINGANNWGAALRDIAANVLRNIAEQLLQIYVIEQAIGFFRNFLTPFSPSTPLGAGGGQVGRFGTFGPNYGIPQFANGGNPPVGRPSIVGERGPELFVPRSSGTIVPNHAMGGVNVGTINISVENTGDQLSPRAQKQLANQVRGVVLNTLANERRGGGML